MISYGNNHEMRFHTLLVYAPKDIDLLYPNLKDTFCRGQTLQLVFAIFASDKTKQDLESGSFIKSNCYIL